MLTQTQEAEAGRLQQEAQCALIAEVDIPYSLIDEYAVSRLKCAKNQQEEVGQRTAKQRDMDLLFEVQDRERRGMEVDNMRLRKLIDMRQKGCQRHEEQAREVISACKLQLHNTTIVPADATSGHVFAKADHSMAHMAHLNKQIQTNVAALHSTIEAQSEADKMNLVRSYRVKMHEMAKELEAEQHHNYTGSQEWIDRNNALRAEDALATSTLNAVVENNQQLARENECLRKLFVEQESERQTLAGTVARRRLENKRLKEQVRTLEAQSLALTERTTTGGSTSVHRLAPLQRSEDAALLATLSDMKHEVHKVRNKTASLRSVHIALLQARSDVEAFLRQCLCDVRHDMSDPTHSTMLPLLASKERILTRLYAEALPFKKVHDQVATVAPKQPQAKPAGHMHVVQEDMNALCQKWGQWLAEGRGGKEREGNHAD